MLERPAATLGWAALRGGHWCGRVEGRGPPTVVTGCSPPRLDDRDDLEDVDHCFFRPLPARGSPLLLLGWEGSPEAWSWAASSLASSAAPLSSSLNWAILRDSMSCASFSSSRMLSMFSPYHSSCQHQACRWALTITFRRPRAGDAGKTKRGLCQGTPGTPRLGSALGCRSGSAAHPLLGLQQTTVSPTPRFISPCANEGSSLQTASQAHSGSVTRAGGGLLPQGELEENSLSVSYMV